ncbi:MAG: FKBP-type peptidyl-prolyl cis-trans isomerase [Saprospiraceae bacterium]|nr:FKBP-type peptidyl-prolyl cis-trans isomerase [Saprospiraceae bacterium]
MRIIISVVFIWFSSAIALFAQNSLDDYFKTKNLQPKSTSTGLYYIVNEESTGKKPMAGDYVKVSYVGRLLNGEVFDSTATNDPFIFQSGYRQVIQGLEQGVQLMNVGSKYTLFVPYNLGYGSKGVGAKIPPQSDLIFDIQLQDIMTWEQYDKYMQSLDEKERLAFKKAQDDQFLIDKKLIQDFALSHKIKAKRLPNGVSYYITKTKSKKNQKIKNGYTTQIHYEGFLVNDTLFDSNMHAEPLTFKVGEGKVIQGLDEGIVQFGEGDEGWILIPSQLAYGPQPIKEGSIDIPANSVLLFKIKVVKASHP